MTDNIADAMPFSRLIDVRVDSASAERIVARLEVTEELCTTGGILHGGAAMAFADSLGAIGAFLTLPEGAGGHHRTITMPDGLEHDSTRGVQHVVDAPRVATYFTRSNLVLHLKEPDPSLAKTKYTPVAARRPAISLPSQMAWPPNERVR